MEERREHLKHDILESKVSQVVTEKPETQHNQAHRIEKTAGTGTFHKILEEKIHVGHERQTIAKKLTDILGFNLLHNVVPYQN